MARNRNTGEYTVIKGDTLSEIAASISINYEDLMEINDKESSYIQPGDKLKVPEENVYTIKQGDTLSEIGVKYHMKATSLAALNGTDVRRIIYVGDKLIVKNPESTEGKTETPDDNEAPSETTKVDYDVDKLVKAANSVKGTEYVWGGTDKSGFDCSGFIYWAYNAAGKKLDRASTDTYFSKSYGIKETELQDGDLVFFAGTYRTGISHMGIYVGDNKFTHAATSTGVTTTSLDNPYWAKHFDSYRRFY